MSQHRFKELSENLLRAGIAPRHVRRYVAELRDHYDDLLRDEKAKGVSHSVAEDAALARLGDNTALAQVMLDQPHMRSVVSRHPWAVLGLGPITLAITIIIASVFAYRGIGEFYRPDPNTSAQVPATWRTMIDGWNLALMYVIPLLLAALAMAIGLLHRITTTWTVGGAVLLVGLASFFDIFVQWPTSPGQTTSLSFGIGFGFYPPYPKALIEEGFGRLAVNFAVLAAIYAFWKHRLSAEDAH